MRVAPSNPAYVAENCDRRESNDHHITHSMCMYTPIFAVVVVILVYFIVSAHVHECNRQAFRYK